MIVRFIDIGGIDDYHCLNFLFVRLDVFEIQISISCSKGIQRLKLVNEAFVVTSLKISFQNKKYPLTEFSPSFSQQQKFNEEFSKLTTKLANQRSRSSYCLNYLRRLYFTTKDCVFVFQLHQSLSQLEFTLDHQKQLKKSQLSRLSKGISFPE